MELRRVDPRILIPDPKINPRGVKASPEDDRQLAASMVFHGGPFQPPTVRENDDGQLVIKMGHRRVACSITAGIEQIYVLVTGSEPAEDGLRAFAENVIRKSMCSVDIWRAVEGFIDQGFTEQAIGSALDLSIRNIRRLRLFGLVHPAMLDRIAQGDEPNERQLRIIASATRDEQAAAWKKNKPKKTERTLWHLVEAALRRERISASVATFDDEHARQFGIHWTEDLFVEGDEDPRFTDQVELFMAAQHAWVEQHLPTNGQMLEVNQHGGVKLPANAQEAWGSDQKRKGARVGFYVNPQSGEVMKRHFLFPEQVKKQSGQPASGEPPTKATRPDISSPGYELIGTYRTEALQQALGESEIRDDQLIGLLVLALAGDNIRVEQDPRMYRIGRRRQPFARSISEGGLITADPETLRIAARGILKEVLCCKVGMTGSGLVARIAGSTLGADGFLPNMAHDDFLTKLSKDGITRAVQAERILPRNTGKEMRAALKEHVGQGSYVHPAARFELTDAEQTQLAEDRAADLAAPSGDEPDEETAPYDDDDLPPDGQEDQGDDGADDLTLPPPGGLAPEQHAAA